ncbi:MAG: glutathione S-transferase [Alphaproteobacteria bacterium]|nr:glutathione S-transferase [Alphaproteobacteria bacterium]
MLKIWGRATSINVQKVMWAIGELDLDYERFDVGGKFGGLDSPEIQARNPHGLIPILEDNSATVWESHAIVRYLAAQYGDGSLWPAYPAARSTADMWMEWAQTVLQHDFIQLFWNLYRTPVEHHDHTLLADLTAKCADNFSQLDRVLGKQPFITGDQFTYGDIPIATQFYRYFTLDIERPSIPNVEAWYERLTKNPAYAEHVMVPYEDLQARLAP